MRKILAFLVLLILPWTARGQALADWYYWFDSDKTPRESGKLSAQNTQLNVDVSQLEVGAHMLYVQVVDAAGVSSTPVGNFFYRVPVDNSISKMYYTINGESATHGLDLGNGSFMLDVSKCRSGLNTINIHVADNHGLTSIPLTYLFCKVPPSTKLTKFFYWLDSSTTANELPFGEGEFVIDVSDLHQGFHVVNYCALDDEGLMTDIKSSGFYRLPVESNEKLHYWLDGDTVATEVPNYKDGFVVDVTKAIEGFNTIYFQMEDNGPADIKACHFVKVPQTENGGDMTLVCIIDGKIVGEEKVAAHGGVVKCDMDVSNMEVGLHKAMFQLITPSGSGSSIAETYFVRTLTDADIASMQCSYTIDGFIHGVEKGTCTNGAFHFDLPVDKVEDGLHRLDYRLVADNGASTIQNSEWFYKTPLGGNKIIQYDYWLNSKSDEVQSVQLSEPKDPFQLIKLLPVSKEPIRTDCFHFEVRDGVPMMYAKNDIHFRFHDKSGRYVDADKQYVDYNVKQEVKDIIELQSTQTFERPGSNRVKWFKFESNYGDSIALKSNQAVTIQVLNAVGKKLYSASGSKSVNYGGCHLFDDGTFYVAVHDVTGSGNNVTIDAKRIEKYAVFEFTPNRMSGVGKTLMYFKGNGLDQVKSVELFNDEISIKADTIVATSSDMLVRFTSIEELSIVQKLSLKVFFNNIEKGESKTLIFANAVAIEPVKDGKITVNIVTERRVGDPFPIRVTLKNNSNLGSYGVPLNIAYDNVEKIDEFRFVNFDLMLSESAFQSKDFFTYTDNLLGKGKKGFFMPLLIPYIGPYEEMTLVFGVKTKIAHAMFNFYAWAGDPWYVPSVVYHGNQMAKAKRAVSNDPCDDSDSNIPRPQNDPDNYNDPSNKPEQPYDPDMLYGPGDAVDDLADLPIGPGQTLRPWLGVAEAIAGIIQGSTRAREDAVMEAYGLDPSDPANNDYRFHYRYSARSPRDIFSDAHPFQAKSSTYSMAKASTSSGRTVDDYARNPCPEPPSHPTDVWIPGDPNEMTGYVSRSGSLYMPDSIKNISYDVEFENDPEIANSSAHVIVIENQLDASKFDFSSFCPKDITISGNRIELDGETNFVKTIDLRPSINAIGELRCDYDVQKGLATWTLTSLDPMTMEPTDDIMQGILPVNYDGISGIGNVTYSIDLKSAFPDGTEISNKASIIFDSNDAIETPIWTNTIDAVPPTSRVSQLEIVGNDSVCVHFEGADERSGVWKYELYVQHGDGSAWWKEAETDSTCCGFRFYNNIKYSFCVLAIDSAGNVERKEFAPEQILYVGRKGDVNTDGEVNVTDIVYVADHILGNVDERFDAGAADMNDDNEINVTDIVYIADDILNGVNESVVRVKSSRSLALNTTGDALSIEPFDINAGETKYVTLDMSNAGYDVTAFQCDITLPEGLRINTSAGGKTGVRFNTESRRAAASTHSLVTTGGSSSKNKVVCYSVTNTALFGHNGAVVDIPITADATMPGGEYELLIDNITMTCKDKKQLNPKGSAVRVVVNNTTSVLAPDVDDTSAEYYNVNGQRRETLNRGVNIIRREDNVNKILKK